MNVLLLSFAGLFVVIVAVAVLATVLNALITLSRRKGTGGGQQHFGQSAFDGTLPASSRVVGAFSSDVTPELSLTDLARVQDLLRQHQKLAAIKLYTEQTGIGLKEAKDAVEDLERSYAGQFAPGTQSSRSAADAREDILALVREGQKIQAIKLYRDQTPGVGLKEAKDVIEALERGEDVPLWTTPLGTLPTFGVEVSDTASLPLGEIRALLRQNQKIEAIKLYRDHTHVGLKEAKDAVEAIERAGL